MDLLNFLVGAGRNPKDCKKTGMKKLILEKERCIYKMPNDKKEYIKYKGALITVKKFISMRKAKAKVSKVSKVKSTKRVGGSNRTYVEAIDSFSNLHRNVVTTRMKKVTLPKEHVLGTKKQKGYPSRFAESYLKSGLTLPKFDPHAQDELIKAYRDYEILYGYPRTTKPSATINISTENLSKISNNISAVLSNSFANSREYKQALTFFRHLSLPVYTFDNGKENSQDYWSWSNKFNVIIEHISDKFTKYESQDVRDIRLGIEKLNLGVTGVKRKRNLFKLVRNRIV
jgi:hypothetical protein